MKLLIYPYKHKYVLNRGPALLKIAPPALNLGVETKLRDFTPIIIAYHMGSDASTIKEGDIFLNVRVNEEIL